MSLAETKGFDRNPRLFLGCILFLSTSLAHAQAACPPGTIPYGSGSGQEMCGPDDTQSTEPQGNAPAPPMWMDKWMAIATDPDRSVLGVATYMATEEQAKSAALLDCKKKGGINCKFENAYRNQCAAMIVGSKGYNLHSGATVGDAIDAGMAVCDADASSCRVYYAACSLPVRVR